MNRLVSSVPIDRVAARVIGRGEGHDVTLKASAQKHWSAPPLCQPQPPNAPDIIGAQFGRFRVIGYIGSHPKKGASWLCRCACGDYETRRTRAVQNVQNADDCCRRCRGLEYIKKLGSSARGGDGKGRAP